MTPERIVEWVAADHHLSVAELLKPDRHRDVVRPRQLAMYLVRNMTDLSLPAIGRLFGDRHHTTVLHAVEVVEADPRRRRVAEQARERLERAA